MTELVAPYTGAWIEIGPRRSSACPASVAPYTGAWIEIVWGNPDHQGNAVAPYTGAWIEITCFQRVATVWQRRSLHGSVD
mgnify:CR=1 FL=1